MLIRLGEKIAVYCKNNTKKVNLLTWAEYRF